MQSSRNQAGVKADLSILKGVHVLVVEDTWHVAEALKSALERIGMLVSGPAATSVEAKQLIAKRMPAVAVVDINLKREMACELIDELYAQDVRVLVVSGYAVPPVSAEKVDCFLQKPFTGAELLGALHAIVGKLRLH